LVVRYEREADNFFAYLGRIVVLPKRLLKGLQGSIRKA
jgi:hypothetical protein